MSLEPNLKANSLMLRVKRLKLIGFIVVLAERLSAALWRLFFWSLFFIALWLFRLPEMMGPFWAQSTLVIAAIGAAYFLWSDARGFRWPKMAEVQRRLEIAGEVAHHPLTALDDAPIEQTAEAKSLWVREQARIIMSLRGLKLFMPRAFIASRDPYGLRAIAILGIVTGFVVAGPDSGARILSGLSPFQKNESAASENITLIFNPPDYTGAAQITLHKSASDPIKVPEGSQLKLIVRRSFALPGFDPVLRVGEQDYPLSAADESTSVLEMDVQDTTGLSLREGLLPIARWPIEIIKDQPPQISVSDDPSAMPQGQIKIPITLLDDYGVRTITMDMRLKTPISMAIGQDAHEERSVMSPAGKDFQIAPLFDLTAHPWAGMDALITLSAVDAKGQTTSADPIELILPERAFNNPLARELITMRKDIIAKPLDSYIPSAAKLEGFLASPGGYQIDRATRMALRALATRMEYNSPSAETSVSLIALIWDTALHLEDGNLSLSARNLQEIRQDLQDALNNPETTQEEIAILMEKLRDAMTQYMQALAQEYQKRIEAGQMMKAIPAEMFKNVMDGNGLQKILDQMEAEAMAGNKDAAQNLLSQLQRMMDMANPSMQMAMPQDLEAQMQAIDDLKSLISDQEDLMRETQNQAELLSMIDEMGLANGKEKPPFLHSEKDSDAQQALSDRLKQIMQNLSDSGASVPDNFPLAQEAMDGAARSLAENAPDIALGQQQHALKLLKDAQEQIQQAAQERLSSMTGISLFSGGMPRDPLGRPSGQARPDDVKIPSERERQRLREIVDELRRRVGQRDRPPEELDYYRRLLKRF